MAATVFMVQPVPNKREVVERGPFTIPYSFGHKTFQRFMSAHGTPATVGAGFGASTGGSAPARPTTGQLWPR